jgi:hypothetical protein
MTETEHVVHVGEMENAHRILVGNHEGRGRLLERHGVGVGLLKCISRK